MADKRINALATTASSTASDDFFAVDGTTNGTRKLNAFSPTFGGNVVVTGTLTSNSTLSTTAGLSCQNADITGGYITLRGFGSQDGGLIFLGQSANNNYINSSATAISTAIANTAVVRAQAEGWRVLTTTASTNTTTGALVVGNGTSGGLGVGGAIYAGGNIVNTSGSDFASVSSSLASIHTVSGAPRITLIRSASSLNNKYFDIVNNSDGQVSFRFVDDNLASATTALSLTKTNATVAAGLTVTTNLAVNGSTASTSTSSGALVVSGGVGVAGNLSIGGNVLIDKSAIEVLLKRSADTNDGLIKFQTGIFGDFGIGHRGTSDSDLHIYNYGTAADALKIAKSDSLATFAAAIRTAAPSGGTAANWKLGTVATVSPTSPNRTIEVDIGGTIYYIHAKTTNN